MSPPRRPLVPRAPLLAALAAGLLAACGDETAPPAVPPSPPTGNAALVNPLVGTLGLGNTVPGALVPHGMVKLSPDSADVHESVDAYDYASTRLEGFSHTHLEGPGSGPVSWGYSELLVAPVRGDAAAAAADYTSGYTHDTEVAHPGYYAVDLTDAEVRAELTATAHCGVHRYTWQGTRAAALILDVGHTRGAAVSGEVTITGHRTLDGRGSYTVQPLLDPLVESIDAHGSTGARTLYFHAELSRPFDGFGTLVDVTAAPGARHVEGTRVGAYVAFGDPREPVELRLCISAIDGDAARASFDAEVRSASFGDVERAADAAWADRLGRIQVEGGSDDQRRTFYTALYHSLFQLTDYDEAGRFWAGADGVGEVFDGHGHHHYSDDTAIWDTFRTTHPLQILVEPETRSDVVGSLVQMYEQGGWLDRGPWAATGFSRFMIADHAVAVFADALAKGFDDYDVGEAYAAAYHNATSGEDELSGLCGYVNLGTVAAYREGGWVPYECDHTQSGAMTLEYAYDDWALSRAAAILGKKADSAAFAARAESYANVWNPAHGFMQVRDADGSFREPFDPTDTSIGNGFTESTSWIYSFFAPHDVRGLIGLVGGRDAFVAKLDAYFDGGHHDAGNEPGFFTPWLYLYAGRPDRTADRIRAILADHFGDLPDGLPGNDDSGAMSAYYVLAALGLYPAPGPEPIYLVGSPIFERATLRLDRRFFPGSSFVVEAKGTSADARYVQSAKLDGTPLARPWITHTELVSGGTLELTMGPAPSSWGTDPAVAPPSLSDP